MTNRSLSLTRLDTRAILEVKGSDCFSFLEGLLTNSIAGMPVGEARYAGLLTPQGKVISEMILYHTADAVLIELDRERLETVMKRLLLYRLRADVHIRPADELSIVIHPHDTRSDDMPASLIRVADPRHDAMPFRSVIERRMCAAFSTQSADYDMRRFELGLAEGNEIDFEKDFWLETGAERFCGVSFAKGCYVGQELTARMKHLTSLKKAILPVTLSSPVPASPRPVAALREPDMAAESTAATPTGKETGYSILDRKTGKSAGTLRTSSDTVGLAMIRFDRLSDSLFLEDTIKVTVTRPSLEGDAESS